jgi:hypothetical protein
MEERINMVALRKLLNAAFSDEELEILCLDHFRAVYDSFSTGMSRLQKTHILITWCERNGRFAELLQQVQIRNPYQYDLFIEAITSPPAAPPPEPTPAEHPAFAEDVNVLQQTLNTALRTLSILEQQAAGYTALTIPAHLQIDLDEKRKQVEDLRLRLHKSKGG